MKVTSEPKELELRILLKEIHERVPAEYYDQGIRKNLFQRFWHQQRFSAITGMTEPVVGRVLDVGCNGCTFTALISKKTRASSTWGIDISKSALSYARAKQMGFHLFLGDCENLPFQGKSFDAVFCLEVLEHLIQPEKALQEIRRCLKDEGYSILLVPIETPLFRLIWFFWAKLKGKVWEGAHVNHLDVTSFKNLVTEGGFKIVKDRVFLMGMLESIKIVKAI